MAVRSTIKKYLKNIARPIYRKVKQNLEFNYKARPSEEAKEKIEKGSKAVRDYFKIK